MSNKSQIAADRSLPAPVIVAALAVVAALIVGVAWMMFFSHPSQDPANLDKLTPKQRIQRGLDARAQFERDNPTEAAKIKAERLQKKPNGSETPAGDSTR